MTAAMSTTDKGRKFADICSDYGGQLDADNKKSFAEICAEYGLNIASVQKAFKREFGGGFDRSMEVTKDHWGTLPPLQKIAGGIKVTPEKKATAKQSKPEVANVVVNEPKKRVVVEPLQPKTKAFNLDGMRDSLYMALLFLAPIGHAILVWNEAWARYGQKGFFAGLTMTIITLAALLLCLDDTKGVTNKTALYLVGILDFCAFFLHREEFGNDPVSTGFAVIIPLCSFAALYMLREVKNL
jgi:hypothetical protein